MAGNKIQVATYKEVKEIPNTPDKVLVDVREPQELSETGVIPGSVNIPLGKIQTAFSDGTNLEGFKKLYRIDKPNKDKCIIVFCRTGSRSQEAAEMLQKLGYKNVKNYKGSWVDWAKKENLK